MPDIVTGMLPIAKSLGRGGAFLQHKLGSACQALVEAIIHYTCCLIYSRNGKGVIVASMR